jgi:hypothetical protein
MIGTLKYTNNCSLLNSRSEWILDIQYSDKPSEERRIYIGIKNLYWSSTVYGQSENNAVISISILIPYYTRQKMLHIIRICLRILNIFWKQIFIVFKIWLPVYTGGIIVLAWLSYPGIFAPRESLFSWFSLRVILYLRDFLLAPYWSSWIFLYKSLTNPHFYWWGNYHILYRIL